MKINLIKLTLDEIREMGRKTALITTDEKSDSIYKKLPLRQPLKNDIKLDRYYHTHKALFKRFEYFILNGGLDSDIVFKDNQTGEELLLILKEIINAKIIENQFDYDPKLRTILDICEELFLQKKYYTNIHGQQELIKGSISYSNLDESEFKQFIDKVIYLLSDNLGLSYNEFELGVFSGY